MIKDLLSSLTPYTSSLKTEKLPIFLYGMGDGAEKIYKYISSFGIKIKGVVCSDEFKREKEFLNFKILSLSEAEKLFGRLCLVVCFGLEGEKTALLKKLSEKHKIISPNVAVIGDDACDYEYIKENAESFEKVFSLLADEKSKEIFVSLIKYNITGDISCLDVENSDTVPDGYYNHNKRHIDVGAYDGDTALDYAKNNKNYKDIVAFEPDKTTYKKLCANVKDLPRVIPENKAVCDKDGFVSFTSGGGRASKVGEGESVESVTIDKYCGFEYISSAGTPVGSIKIDAEGMDEAVVCGAKNVIFVCKSALCVSVYHRRGDIIDLPLLLRTYDYKYKFYLRKKEYYPAWDVVLYCIHQY